MTDTTLTDTERAALAAYLRGQGITDEPDKYDDGIHSWRCAFPATYGRCGCFAEAITDLSAAVESIVAARVADRDGRAGRILDGRTWDEYPQEVSRG